MNFAAELSARLTFYVALACSAAILIAWWLAR